MTFDSSATIRVNSEQIEELMFTTEKKETASAIRHAIQFCIDHSETVKTVAGQFGHPITIPGLLKAMKDANIEEIPLARQIRRWCKSGKITAFKAYGSNEWLIPWDEALRMITSRLSRPTINRMN